MKKESNEDKVPKFNKVQYRRLIYIDKLIRNNEYPNATELAKDLEVSVRTINRDIDFMKEEQHLPIEFDRNKNGYYYTEPNVYLKTLTLSEGELFSIALFDRLLEQYKNTPLENNLKNIFSKIISNLPDIVTVDTAFFSNQMTFIPEQNGIIDTNNFNTIFNALKNHHVLEYEYRPLQKTTWMNRRLNPLHAVCQKGNWYIIGWCHTKQDIRIFNFSRIKNAVETKEVFTSPPDFTPDKYFDREIGVWLSNRQKLTVELLISAEIGTFALEHNWTANQKIEQREDGSVWVNFETTQLQEIKRWVLGQGKTVKVLNPPELIEQIKKEIHEMTKLYE